MPGAYATPFMHPDLIRAWLAVMGWRETSDPFFLHASHSDGQEVFWLLVRSRASWQTGWIRRLVPAGDGPGGPYFAYNDPLVAPEFASDQVFAHGFWLAFHRELRARAGSWFDSCTFHRLRPDCLEAAAGEPVAKGSTYVRLDAYADFEAYAAARPPALASQVRRKLRRLQSEGRCEFHVHGPGEREVALSWVPRLEAGRLIRYPGSVLPPGYLQSIVAEGFDSALVRCSTFKIGRDAPRIPHLSPARRRRCIEHVMTKLDVSERLACRVLGQHRSTQRKTPKGRADDATLTADIVELATQYGRYGYRRITAMLRAAGWTVNVKRVERIWRLEGLKVPG
jgi:hypothetical protein